MTHGREKSDSAIVAGKPTNKAEQSAAEPVEPRAEAEGNAGQQSMCRAQDRASVSQALERIRQAARQRKKEKFTALFHHLTIDLLEDAFNELKEDAAAGVDGVTWKEYDANLERNLEDLHARLHRGAYRALPSRRVYIPKPDGRQRPLAVAALEDKVVQRATVAVLNAIYEEDFLGFSYGFRPGRGTHDALDALCVGINSKKVNFILDADIRSFFDSVSQSWLVRFVEHRIGDPRITRLIRKWLKAGVLEDGVVTNSDRGTGQGSVISPLLANIYLHYVLDLWAERWRRREAKGDMIIVRYADVRRRMHQPIPVQGKWLGLVVSGYFNYHAVPTNSRALHAFRHYVAELWQRSLRRRSQKDGMTWERFTQLANDWLPKPRILHPWPDRRFAVKHPRWEPYARIGPVRLCAGGAQ
jgi:retron-type reverse transcriptase